LNEVEKSRTEESNSTDLFDSSTFNSSTSSIAPARGAAYRILREVEQRRGFAVELLQRPPVAALNEPDRRLATELVMGVLRWGGELDYLIEQLSGRPLKYFDPEVATVLRLGIYQMRFLGRIPKSAAVNQSVELVKRARKRSAAALVNAVLRKCPGNELGVEPGRQAVSPDPGALEAALRSLPRWLRERWQLNFGPEGAASLAWVSVSTPCTTLRVTARTEGREALLHELSREGVEVLRARYAARGLVVQSGSVQASRAWREGRVVIQDEASQLIAELVAPKAGQRILDLCAAPGMKTAQLAAALTAGTLVACDRSLRRLHTTVKLLPQHLPAGVRAFVVCQDATRSLALRMQFDRILLDAPCSGTGTLARNPEIKWRLQPGDVLRLAESQRNMLCQALGVLAKGGRLVYATCSLEPEENEKVVEQVLDESQGFRLLTRGELVAEFLSLSELFDPRGFFRTRPDLHGMDGFFAAVLARV
jgi:16S rRNA (cytosine967-C5)-methyltransferase